MLKRALFFFFLSSSSPSSKMGVDFAEHSLALIYREAGHVLQIARKNINNGSLITGGADSEGKRLRVEVCCPSTDLLVSLRLPIKELAVSNFSCSHYYYHFICFYFIIIFYTCVLVERKVLAAKCVLEQQC